MEGNTLEERRALRLAPPMRPWGVHEDFIVALALDENGSVPYELGRSHVAPKLAHESKGTMMFPLTEMIASDIRAHGTDFAHAYHTQRGVSELEWKVLHAGAKRLLSHQIIARMLRDRVKS